MECTAECAAREKADRRQIRDRAKRERGKCCSSRRMDVGRKRESGGGYINTHKLGLNSTHSPQWQRDGASASSRPAHSFTFLPSLSVAPTLRSPLAASAHSPSLPQVSLHHVITGVQDKDNGPEEVSICCPLLRYLYAFSSLRRRKGRRRRSGCVGSRSKASVEGQRKEARATENVIV